jgi:hypothetical protein
MDRMLAALVCGFGMLVAQEGLAQIQASVCSKEGGFRIVRELRQPKAIVAMAASRDSRYAASMDEEGALTLWDLSDGRRALEVWLQESWMSPIAPTQVFLAFSPKDYKLYVAAMAGGETHLRRFDLFPDDCVAPVRMTALLKQPMVELRSMAISPDGELLAFGGIVRSGDAQVARVDLVRAINGALTRSVFPPGYKPYAMPLVALAGIGKDAALFTAEDSRQGISGPVHVHSLSDQQTAVALKGSAGRKAASALGASADGSMVVAGFQDGQLIAWRRDADTREFVEQAKTQSSDSQPFVAAGVWEPPQAPLVPYGLSATAELAGWSEDGKPQSWRMPVSGLGAAAFLQDRFQILLATRAGVLRMANASTRAEPGSAHRSRMLGAAVGVVASPDDDAFLATYATEGSGRVGLLVSAMTGMVRRVFPEPVAATGIFRFGGHGSAILGPSQRLAAPVASGRPPPEKALWSATGKAWLLPGEGGAGFRVFQSAEPRQAAAGEQAGDPGQLLAQFQLPEGLSTVVAFDTSSSGRDVVLIAVGTQGAALLHWDSRIPGFRARHSLGTRKPLGVAVSADGALAIVLADDALLARLAPASQAPTAIALPGRARAVAVAFAPTGSYALIAGDNSNAYTLDADGKPLPLKETGMRGNIVHAAPGPRANSVLTAGEDGAVRLWDLAEKRESVAFLASEPRRVAGVAQPPSITEIDWSVIDFEGRFHAANAADVFGVHWALALQAIAPGELRQANHDPSLLGKHMGLSAAKLAPLARYQRDQLTPYVSLPQGAKGSLIPVAVTVPPGASMGGYVIYVNGIEAARNVERRQAGTSHDAVPSTLFLPGLNRVVVKALDTQGRAVGRGTQIEFSANAADVPVPPKPRLLALVAGVSRQSTKELTLDWADRDAMRFADALRRVAVAQLGQDAVTIRLLTSDASEEKNKANRANILGTLAEFEKLNRVSPNDILVVFLAGHGGDDGGSYYFVGTGATPGILADPVARADVTVGAAELKEAIERIKAHRLLVFDTCNSRAFATKDGDGTFDAGFINGSILSARDLNEIQGTHVLYGSWLTRTAYESRRYRHGLVTYALLSGMLGLARDNAAGQLRAQGLFRHAEQQIPKLAGAIDKRQESKYLPGIDIEVGKYTAADWKDFEPLEGLPVVVPPRLERAKGSRPRDPVQEELGDLLAGDAEVRSRFAYAGNWAPAFSFQLWGTYESAAKEVDATGKLLTATYELWYLTPDTATDRKIGESRQVTAARDELARKVHEDFVEALAKAAAGLAPAR